MGPLSEAEKTSIGWNYGELVGSFVALWFLIENLREKNVVNLFRVESLLIEPS